MNSDQGVTFFNGNYGATNAATMSQTTPGSIVFDQQSKSIYVDGIRYGGEPGDSELSDASFDNDILKIWKTSDPTETPSIQIDLSSFDSAKESISVFRDIADEMVKNERTITTTFGAIQQSVGLDANMHIQFENPSIADETTVKGAIEKLAESSGAAWKDWD